jgi:hypothetical protein
MKPHPPWSPIPRGARPSGRAVLASGLRATRDADVPAASRGYVHWGKPVLRDDQRPGATTQVYRCTTRGDMPEPDSIRLQDKRLSIARSLLHARSFASLARRVDGPVRCSQVHQGRKAAHVVSSRSARPGPTVAIGIPRSHRSTGRRSGWVRRLHRAEPGPCRPCSACLGLSVRVRPNPP